MSDLTIDRLIKAVKKYRDQEEKLPLEDTVKDQAKIDFNKARNDLLNSNDVKAILSIVLSDLEKIEAYGRGEPLKIGSDPRLNRALLVHVLSPPRAEPLSKEIEFAYEWAIGLTTLQKRVCLQTLSENLCDLGFGPIIIEGDYAH